VLSDYVKRTGQVWRASDMWSVGVIIFLFVCGYPPFNGDSQEKIFHHIKKGKFRFPTASTLSESVKDLVMKLLRRNPLERLTAAQVLEHPWVKGDTATDTPISEDVIKSLFNFRHNCRLKKAVARVMAHRMTDTDQTHLLEAFRKFDTNGDGHLGPSEITAMMKQIGMGHVDAKEWLAAVDEDHDGTVSPEEFATAAQLGKLGASAEDVKASFDLFDSDRDGFVTHKEIERLCTFLTPDAAKSMIDDVDANRDGKINFDEWLIAMKGVEKRMNTVNSDSDLSKK